MRRCSHTLGLVLSILLGGGASSLAGQEPAAGRSPDLPIREEVVLRTDRTLYVAGEDIFFRADRLLEGLPGEEDWSSVLYVELVEPGSGTRTRGRFALSDGVAMGRISIPADMLTGWVYLKAYTRWMRNQGPGEFAWLPLRLVNPDHKSLNAGSRNPGSGAWERPLADGDNESPESGLGCRPLQEVVKPGDSVRIALTVGVPLPAGTRAFCLSVAEEGCLSGEEGAFQVASGESAPGASELVRPDLGRSLGLGGTVVDSGKGPVPFAEVSVSLLGRYPDFFVTTADGDGRFLLDMQLDPGDKELFVCPGRIHGTNPQVRIELDFEDAGMPEPLQPFVLSDTEREAARKLALRRQVARVFGAEGARPDSAPPVDWRRDAPFYGTQVERLNIDDYIRLPNLEEVFLNLVPQVQFYRKRGERQVHFINPNPIMEHFKPLILVDNIPVFDLDALLRISPDRVSHIEWINDVYLKGNLQFGGILAVTTRKGDLAGIDLPRGGYFFDLQATEATTAAHRPDYDSGGIAPDVRNTVYWDANVNLTSGGESIIAFPAPELPGTYHILLRGILPSGEVVGVRGAFRVADTLKTRGRDHGEP
ncbi:MAG: carboxypeptidase-like regulatory domain-containing protein [Bacteroidales bacterium]